MARRILAALAVRSMASVLGLDSFSLVQLRAGDVLSNSTEYAGSLSRTKPEDLKWLHIPKCGSSFGTTLVGMNCHGLPEDFSIGESGGAMNANKFNKLYAAEYCKHGWTLQMNHKPLGEGGNADVENSHYVGMFRRPEQRLISDFYWGRARQEHDTALTYSKRFAGCAVRMMTGDNCDIGATSLKVDNGLVHEAVGRLSRFTFVGLVEEWSLSICLFHAMFGGKCYPRELLRTRKGGASSEKDDHGMYEETMLHGWKDEADGKLYSAVSHIFWANVKAYGLSQAVCEKRACA